MSRAALILHAMRVAGEAATLVEAVKESRADRKRPKAKKKAKKKAKR